MAQGVNFVDLLHMEQLPDNQISIKFVCFIKKCNLTLAMSPTCHSKGPFPIYLIDLLLMSGPVGSIVPEISPKPYKFGPEKAISALRTDCQDEPWTDRQKINNL